MTATVTADAYWLFGVIVYGERVKPAISEARCKRWRDRLRFPTLRIQ